MNQFKLRAFSILLLFLSVCASAQSKLFVEYDLNTYGGIGKATLIGDKNSSFYNENTFTEQGSIIDESTNSFTLGGSSSFNIIQNSKEKNRVYIETKNYSQEKKEIEYIIDEIPPLDWDISTSSETIEIQGFKCREARVQFRGSVYIAYFTDEIPIPFGPWKFSGLPGLILKVYSKDNPKHSWEAAKIVYPYETTQNTEFDPSIYTLTLKDAVEKSDKYKEDKGRAMATKIGSVYTSIPPEIRRQKAREVKYEWETW